MNFKEFVFFNEVTQVGFQDIEEKKLFGPVYHGTTEENIEKILQTGFVVPIGNARVGDVRHGYELIPYFNDIPAPVHHLGYGTYMTTVKNIAKDFNQGKGGLKQFYLNVPRLETINFGSPNTMMKWWKNNRYDMPTLSSLGDLSIGQKEELRVKATLNMTNFLKSKFDAVFFKGQGIRRLLDGNQICVFDPKNIYLFNPNLNLTNEFMVGDRVKLKGLAVAISIQGRRTSNKLYQSPWDVLFNQNSNYIYNVKISTTDSEKIKFKYEKSLYDLVLSDSRFEDLRQTRLTNSGESLENTILKYVNYLTNKGNLQLNFPESLLERKLAKRERIIENISYKGEHSAPDRESGAPLYNLTGIFPEDIYSFNGTRYYGDGSSFDAVSISIIHAARGKPHYPVKVYRAVPLLITNTEKIRDYEKQKAYIQKYGKVPNYISTNLNRSQYYDKIHNELELLNSQKQEENKITINPGDWVSINRQYAVEHGQANLGRYRIISKTVKAKDLFTDGSIHEWGYSPI